jgi:hypothetical protein
VLGIEVSFLHPFEKKVEPVGKSFKNRGDTTNAFVPGWLDGNLPLAQSPTAFAQLMRRHSAKSAQGVPN